MYVSSKRKVVFVAINANGRYYRVYPDDEIEIDYYPNGPTRAYRLMDRNEPYYNELLKVAGELL